MTKEQILAFLRNHKQEFSERYGIERMALFGSAVRGNLQPGSDIDLAVEMRIESKNLHNFLAFKRRLEAEFQCPVDLGIESTLRPEVKRAIADEMVYV